MVFHICNQVTLLSTEGSITSFSPFEQYFNISTHFYHQTLFSYRTIMFPKITIIHLLRYCTFAWLHILFMVCVHFPLFSWPNEMCVYKKFPTIYFYNNGSQTTSDSPTFRPPYFDNVSLTPGLFRRQKKGSTGCLGNFSKLRVKVIQPFLLTRLSVFPDNWTPLIRSIMSLLQRSM